MCFNQIKIIAFIVLLCFFIACKNVTESEDSIAVVSFSNASKSACTTDNIDFKYITFHTDSTIGTIDQVAINDGKMYLSDGKNNELYCYNDEGKFISKIGSCGNGPAEYLKISSFFIDTDNRRIGIYDEYTERLMYYSLDDYRFEQSIDISHIRSSGCIEADGYLVWQNQQYDKTKSENYFMTTDLTGTAISSMVKKTFFSGYDFGPNFPMYSFDGNIYGYTPTDDMTVYSIDSLDAYPKFRVEVDGCKVVTAEWMNEKSEGGSKPYYNDLYSSDFISYYRILETEKSLFLFFIKTKEHYIGLYDKRSNSTTLLKKEDFAKMFGGMEIDYFLPQTVMGKYAAVVNPELPEGTDGLDDGIKRYIETEGDNSNPILVLFDLK